MSVVLPSPVTSTLSEGPGQSTIEAGSSFEESGSWVPFTVILALAAWTVAGWTSVAQKMSVDRIIKDSYDISAVQIQQLNGSLTAHVLVAMILAFGATIPLLIALSARMSALLRLRR